MERKINSFRASHRRIPRIDRNVVKNLSSRTLSQDETECLAHELDYGLVPKNIDDMNIVSNVENFFQRVTDISQHHRKMMSEVSDKETVDGSNVRILDSKEMTLASNFRSITDSFRHRAYRFAKLQNRINTEHQRYRRLLQNLKNDKSIVVTRPDKGRGVVLLDKVDYLSKMHSLLNDTAKFSFLSHDPTITRETKLIKLLNRLLDAGSISKDFYSLAKPFGSIPGRLYGLPKVHKEDVPLRPVVSAIKTFNYGLGKVLSQLLSQFLVKKNMIRDSFSFVNQLLALPKYMSRYKMVSFDIASLYTNVPLTETIDIILKHLYDGHAKPPAIGRADMKELLDLATEKSHFLFNGQLYDQIDGVSMGSPLAPLFAEIFLQNFEKKYLSRQLNLVYNPTTPISAKSPTTDTVVLRVPYFGKLSQMYAERIISATNKNYPLKHIRLVYDVKERLGRGFLLKDKIPNQMEAGVVYQATCPQCEVRYIGKTFRHFKTRVHEHLNYQKQHLCLKKIEKSKHTVKRPRSTIKAHMERKGPTTRSQTGKIPNIILQSIQENIENS
ncbi:unnamed protein product [Rotaria sp. Silwood2]|nr:unnamed protein product [Rotaria sp. Silwood2]CAF4248309.1 unnamed protein product [Rotaria sp. Silwood2]